MTTTNDRGEALYRVYLSEDELAHAITVLGEDDIEPDRSAELSKELHRQYIRSSEQVF